VRLWGCGRCVRSGGKGVGRGGEQRGGYGGVRGWCWRWWWMKGSGSKDRRSMSLWAAGLRDGWSGRRAPVW